MNKTLIFVISLVCCNCLTFASDKPNVLFLMSDDLNTALSGFGHPQCKTPHLDKLAEKGVRFENMHCQYPICGASRASLMTGLYPYTNGSMGNVGVNRKTPGLVTLPELFRKNGYRSVRVGKIYHMRIPMEVISGESAFDDPESWDEFYNMKAPEQLAEGKVSDWSPMDKGSQTFRSVETKEGDSTQADGMAADKAIELLGKLKDRPFFMAVGFVRPHVPLVAPTKYFELYNREDMVAPVVPADDLEDVPQVARDYKANDSTYGVTPELHKGLLQAYYASVSYMDAQVGRVLKALKDQELDKNTIVVFTSDHGYLLGQHHKFQKQHLFEESTRVPFIFSVPWLEKQHGGATSKVTELIDVFPTIAELVGFVAPKTLQGTSLSPLLKDLSSCDWTKTEAFTVSRSGGESLRNENWRIIQWGTALRGQNFMTAKTIPASSPTWWKIQSMPPCWTSCKSVCWKSARKRALTQANIRRIPSRRNDFG
jgi:iduronate 2-sulfatase